MDEPSVHILLSHEFEGKHKIDEERCPLFKSSLELVNKSECGDRIMIHHSHLRIFSGDLRFRWKRSCLGEIT